MLPGITSYLSVDLSKITAIISLALILVLVHSFIASTCVMGEQGPIKLLNKLDERHLGQYVQAVSVVKQNSTISNSSDYLAQENTLNTIFNKAQKSIVTITRTLPSPTTVTPEAQNITVLGTGFVYDNQGHIITNNHVVGHAKTVNVLFENGDRYTAKVIGGDSSNDLAVLKLIDKSSQLPQRYEERSPLQIANSSKLQ